MEPVRWEPASSIQSETTPRPRGSYSTVARPQCGEFPVGRPAASSPPWVAGLPLFAYSPAAQASHLRNAGEARLQEILKIRLIGSAVPVFDRLPSPRAPRRESCRVPTLELPVRRLQRNRVAALSRAFSIGTVKRSNTTCRGRKSTTICQSTACPCRRASSYLLGSGPLRAPHRFPGRSHQEIRPRARRHVLWRRENPPRARHDLRGPGALFRRFGLVRHRRVERLSDSRCQEGDSTLMQCESSETGNRRRTPSSTGTRMPMRWAWS